MNGQIQPNSAFFHHCHSCSTALINPKHFGFKLSKASDKLVKIFNVSTEDKNIGAINYFSHILHGKERIHMFSFFILMRKLGKKKKR